jgi:type I restriction enzyme M protein
LSEPIQLSSEAVKNRLDYSHYVSAPQTNSRGPIIRDVAIGVSRGACSSAQRRTADLPIFHTTDFNTNSDWMPAAFTLSRKVASAWPTSMAQQGDILVARVGRNLESKICMVRGGFAIVSDCVLVLRVDASYRERVFRFLSGAQGRQALGSASHGVAARFITSEALLNIEMSHE